MKVLLPLVTHVNQFHVTCTPGLVTGKPYIQHHLYLEPYKKSPPTQQDSYYKPVDMEEVRRKLQEKFISTTERPNTKPKLRFQKPPTEVREWDWERNQWKDNEDDSISLYNQV